jgi:hydrogenase maturation protease
VVVDAVRAVPSVPGRLHRVVLAATAALPGTAVSSHGLGVETAAALAAALGRLPACLIVHAVEVADTTQGLGLTPEVAAAADALADAVLRELTSPPVSAAG